MFKKIKVREVTSPFYWRNIEATVAKFDELYRNLVMTVARSKGLPVADSYATTKELYDMLSANGVTFEKPHGHYVIMTINGSQVMQMLKSQKTHRNGISMTLEYREM